MLDLSSHKKHIPDLQRIADTCGEELEIIGLPIDEMESADRLREYSKQQDLPYSVALDLTPAQRMLIEDVFSQIKPVGALPSSVLTDASGRLIAGKPGVPTVSDVQQQLLRFRNE